MGHLNNELWFYTSNTPLQWIETGTARHCTVLSFTTCSGGLGLDRYIRFWAEIDSSGNEHFNLISSATSHDGNSHTFEINNFSYYPSTDQYDIYVDNNYQGTSSYQNNDLGLRINVGMELYSPPGINFSENSDTFVNTVDVYSTSDTSFMAANLATATVHDVTDPDCLYVSNCTLDPCSTFPGQPCLYWSLSTPNQWTDSKPSSN